MRKNIISGIYCIENIKDNKKYIGQSKNIYDRWAKHKLELNRNNHDNDYLQNAWNKYGELCFTFYILEECDEIELDDKEIYYIELYNTLNRSCGYNLKTGGQNKGIHTVEYVGDKISKSLKDYYKNNSKSRDRCKENALKQWSNPEIKNKIIGENNGMYGKHHTEDAKKKMSEKRKGRISEKRNPNHVICIEKNLIFQDSVTAAKEFGIQSSGILQVCYGKRKTCGGYHWKFLLENNIG